MPLSDTSHSNIITSENERRWIPATALRRLRLRLRRNHFPALKDELFLTPLTAITPFKMSSRRGSRV
ncbi:hypothetical protein CcaverHIS002_0405880 [Cutaneotrichosporon cavernicola]|uniref:Uncharacterized protein n=1 Tax=Cutaneotrichosporon cavernicola TaxID=279322 RepID=A0AA48QVW5_9TREE|nr:uncharacterized protein CcaverHIS019_0405900 [Cutaneotrichosporon cavernicola]BEI83984.1 hypothetical protein CcaverHIS002_0405880 [Cutaneotrichosporon cavernicola]BEI91770.1 hypothetical protein CcaverHIS019_0405900 [Cutaneotrichosporon cavernicola]BEI99542.1 hypothetical protein CcaverHIS631_0405850 [Cutaneotrichosporon cavernicola]BEJ07319.1 hypothetical protein CcaverHIS641_0405880 [Cutaneotrichosporon cavernicola]